MTELSPQLNIRDGLMVIPSVSGQNFSMTKGDGRLGPTKTGRRGSYAKEEPQMPEGQQWPRVYAWRSFRGMTQNDLAGEAELSTGAISDLENFKVGPSIETLWKLADALDCTVGQLFDIDPRPDAPNRLPGHTGVGRT